MPQTLIHVGAVAPSTTAEAAVGSAVPASTTWQVKVWVTNLDGSDHTFTVRQAYADAGADNTQYRAKSANCKAADGIVVLPTFEMSTTDKLYFTSSAGNGLACIADAVAIT
jgi:hypothetical protein